jgi:hypothetical protein
MADVVRRVTITLRRPVGEGDPGHVDNGFYVVDGDEVRLTSAEGEPLRRTATARRSDAATWSRKLRPDEDAGRVARDLLWTKYRAQKGRSDFNRPLRFSSTGIV